MFYRTSMYLLVADWKPLRTTIILILISIQRQTIVTNCVLSSWQVTVYHQHLLRKSTFQSFFSLHFYPLLLFFPARLVCIYFLPERHCEGTSHLLWQRDDRSVLCEGGDPVREVLTAGSENWAVGSETLTLHHHGNITRCVSPALLVQAAQHMWGMHCRLKCKHRWPGGRWGHQGHLYGTHKHTHAHTHM